MTNLTSGGTVQQIVHLCGEVHSSASSLPLFFLPSPLSFSSTFPPFPPRPLTLSLPQGVLKPFCDLLAAKDDKTVGVVLDGVSNILATAEKLGETDKVGVVNVVVE